MAHYDETGEVTREQLIRSMEICVSDKICEGCLYEHAELAFPCVKALMSSVVEMLRDEEEEPTDEEGEDDGTSDQG